MFKALNITLPCVLYSYLKLSDSAKYREGKLKKVAKALEIVILNSVFLKTVKFLKNFSLNTKNSRKMTYLLYNGLMS